MLHELDANGAASLLPTGSNGFCLVEGDRIVGTAIHSDGAPIVHLWGMYVTPTSQRSGGGTRLLRAVQEAVGERTIEVRVLASSTHAVHFYDKHGFDKVGEEETSIMPGLDATCLVMRRRCDKPASEA